VDEPREPIFNIPPVIVLILAACVAVQAFLYFFPDDATPFLLRFAFIPARYDSTLLPQDVFPGGFGAEVWTFVTYAFIHADLSHLGLNALWLVAFGTPVARRFGTVRFLVFFAVTAAVGAAAHLAVYPGEFTPVVGASAAISGAMAAALRFVFHAGGPLGLLRPSNDPKSYFVPAPPLLESLRDSRVFMFLAIWFGVNLLFGITGLGLSDGGQAVAWVAHIGGFVAGLLLFPLFDPVPTARILPS